jgi:hypothetical protein
MLNLQPPRHISTLPNLLRKKRWEAAISGPEREVLEAFMELPPKSAKPCGR